MSTVEKTISKLHNSFLNPFFIQRRKIIAQSFTFFLLLLLFFLPPAREQAAAQPQQNLLFPVALYVGGKNYQLRNPLIQKEGITFASFREIFTVLGAKIGFTSKHGRMIVWAETEKDHFLLERGTTAFYHNDVLLSLPERPLVIEGTFYFPLRFLLDLAGYRLHLEKIPAENNDRPAKAHVYLYRILPEQAGEDRATADTHTHATGEKKPSTETQTNVSLPVRFEPTAQRVPVLMYHHLVPAEENDGSNGAVISVEAFAEQMEYLFAAGYRTATLKDLYLFITGQKDLPPKTVVLTFDDGYASNYQYAYPILKQYHFRAVQFPITGKVNFWVPRMTEEMMTKSTDVFEFHSHSHSLHYYIGDRAAMLVLDAETILEDLRRSRELLDCFAFSYPFGAFSEEVIEMLKITGYKMAFTIRPGYVYPGDDPFLLNRFGVYPETTLEDFIWLLENFN